MQKQTGVHFYINIVNYNSIILDEEEKTHGVTHAIHALDTFFSSIERYGKRISDSLTVEKITGSRLHLYVTGDLQQAFSVAKKVSSYAYQLSKYLKTDIRKYETLKDFHINVGADYGKFYEFEFDAKDGHSELTTIGFVANYAAKLQGLSGIGKLSVSEDVYTALSPEDKKLFEKVDDESIKKYGKVVLRQLFEHGVIGNQPSMKDEQIFKYQYPQALFNFNENMVIHRGLYKALQIF